MSRRLLRQERTSEHVRLWPFAIDRSLASKRSLSGQAEGHDCVGSAYSAATDPERSFGLSICHAPRALGRPVRGEQRTRWPQPRQFDYSGTEPWRGGPVRPDEFLRGNAGRPRRCLVSPLLPSYSCRWFLRAMRRGSTGRNRLMRNRCIGFCSCGVCPRREQRPQSRGERRRRRHGEQGGRGNRTTDRQAGNLLA